MTMTTLVKKSRLTKERPLLEHCLGNFFEREFNVQLVVFADVHRVTPLSGVNPTQQRELNTGSLRERAHAGDRRQA